MTMIASRSHFDRAGRPLQRSCQSDMQNGERGTQAGPTLQMDDGAAIKADSEVEAHSALDTHSRNLRSKPRPPLPLVRIYIPKGCVGRGRTAR